MAASNKDTIYVDIDDEITGIIDKLQDSKGKVVALVLPKRAAVFQSIVNMKLLKRAADNNKKNLVLITSEAGLLPLAGASGIHVAKTLNSKPEIPGSPDLDDDEDEEIQEDDSAEELPDDEPLDATAPVGKLAGAAAADEVETLTLDDDDLPPEDEAPKSKSKDFKPPKKDKKLKIPDFNRFRLLLALGGLLLILLIGGLIFAMTALPKATISIKTDASAVDINVPMSLSTTAKSLDADEGTIPAKLAQQQKSYTQSVPTTGQKNNGNKASGSVVFYNCNKDDKLADADRTIPAGTGISNSGQTFITQQSVTVSASSYSGNSCNHNHASGSVTVVAQSPGAAYNTSGNSSFNVSYQNPGDGSDSFSATTPSGITGGTDNIVQSVNQNDINTAKSKIAATSDAEMKKALKSLLNKENYYAIEATYSTGTPAVTNSANVGEVANNVTVTQVVTYTMFGVKQADLKTLVTNSIKSQIDTSKQSVLDDGISHAAFNVDGVTAAGGAVTLTSTATAGPDLDVATIKANAQGKKPAAVKSDLESNPDVTGVDVKLSPFWVGSVPHKVDKITVDIAKPTSTKASSSNGSD
jgi:hypothetical protein